MAYNHDIVETNPDAVGGGLEVVIAKGDSGEMSLGGKLALPVGEEAWREGHKDQGPKR